MHINDVVSIETLDNIALFCLNNPPVNAASQALRAGLQQAVAQANADTAIDVIAIYAAGRTFVAGADARVWEAPLDPMLPDLINEIEGSANPHRSASWYSPWWGIGNCAWGTFACWIAGT